MLKTNKENIYINIENKPKTQTILISTNTQKQLDFSICSSS